MGHVFHFKNPARPGTGLKVKYTLVHGRGVNRFLQLFRTGNAVMGIVGVVVASFMAAGLDIVDGWVNLIISAVVVFMFICGGNALNDYIDHDMLECMHGTARKENADVVICDYDEECDGQHTLRRQQPTSLKPRQIVIDLLTGKIHGSCCNKLIARHLYTAPGIKFPAGINCCEDLYVCLCIFARNPVVAYLPRAFYHYVRSSTSITSQLTLSNLEQDAKLRDMVIDHFNHDSELQEIASREMSKYVAFRAFHSRRLTSRQFRQAYHQYARYFLDRHNSMFPFNWFFYLACTGWYRTSLTLYDIYIWLWKTKQRLLHRK